VIDYFEKAYCKLLNPLSRGDRCEKDPEGRLSLIRGVSMGMRNLEWFRFTFNVTEHTPWYENRCATVFTSFSPLKRGGLGPVTINGLSSIGGATIL
jgi:hypothetical protein